VRETAQPIDRGWMARIFVDNYPLKLLSLGFAVALFSIVHSDQDAQRSMYLDVVALLPPASADKILVSSLPARVKVTLRGSRSRIAALEHDDFAPVQMDLRDPERNVYHFDPAALGISGPFHVVSIDPVSVQLTWRERTERPLPVRVRLHGTPAAGVVVKGPIVVQPETIKVSGPKEEIDALHELYTEEVSVDGLSAGVHERRARLDPLTGHVSFSGPNAVAIRLELDVQQSERMFQSLEVAVIGPGDVSLRPGAVQVTLRGPARALAELTPEQVVPYVEPQPGVAAALVESLPVKLKGIPETCAVAHIVPSTVLAKHAH
jgi:YbbR-like protein